MKYGLIGEKLSHSFSAQIHSRLFDYEYELKELVRDELDAFLTKRDFSAINVTIPYKEVVIPHLDVVDDNALRIGAVNTVVNCDGKLYGYNTDYMGLKALIERSAIAVCGKKVLILGSGGTSKTAETVVRDMGAREAYRVSRTDRDGCITYEQALNIHRDAQIIINTTPCGMYPNGGASAVDIADFSHLEGVVDVVYNPLRTKLVCDALAKGIPTVGGLYMLVAQAAFAAERFVNVSVAGERIEEVYQDLLCDKENIVLVGMPASGKSTVGKILAKQLGRVFIDTDEEIVRQSGVSIPEIFQNEGEAAFRDKESEAIRKIASVQGAVIATGGGAILRPENAAALKENGRLYFLDRSLDLLATTADRPLSSNREDLERRYRERYPIYTAVCDVRIDGNGTAEEVANLIREDFIHEDTGH